MPFETEVIVEPRFLPAVRHEECGHLWTGIDPLPIDLAPGSAIGEFLRPADRSFQVTLEVWQSIRAVLETEITRQGHPIPAIAPGVRVGPLTIQIEARVQTPDYISFGDTALFSARLLDGFSANGLTGFDAYPVQLRPAWQCMSDLDLRYFELLALAEAPLASEANFSAEKCSLCDLVLNATYTALVVDENAWDGSDFVRVKELGATVVSERVKQAAEDMAATGLQFLPARRIKVGPTLPDFTELIAELEFERQMRDRR